MELYTGLELIKQLKMALSKENSTVTNQYLGQMELNGIDKVIMSCTLEKDMSHIHLKLLMKSMNPRTEKFLFITV